MSDHQQQVWDENYNFRKNNKKLTRLVAEGDSWFCYPIWRSLLDFISASNQYAICRRGTSGRRLREIVEDGLYLKAVKSEKPKALLISGGGNDFANEQFVSGDDGEKPLFNAFQQGMKAEDVIFADKWSKKLDEIADLFETIVLRTGDIPIIAHTYDNILPTGEPAAYDGLHIAGPWILPSLTKQNVPVAMHRQIAMLMIESFGQSLRSVANVHPNFVIADLIGTCVDSDWANEIHPFESGYKAMADKKLVVIRNTLAAPPSAAVIA